jgi:hypothetical protein
MIAHITPSVHSQASLLTWLRCRACHRGYITAGAPIPRLNPTYTGDWLRLVGVWHLRAEQVPQGRLARPVAQEGRL